MLPMGFENGKLFRVVLRATRGDDSQVCTLHYDAIDAIGAPANSGQSLADAFRDDVQNPFQGLYSNDWEIQPIEVFEELDPQDPTDAREAWVSGDAVAGSKLVSTDLLPAACCQVVSLRTNHIGRRHRGRIFVGGSYGEADQSGGIWGALAIGLAQNFVNAIPVEPDIQGGPSASSAHWCIYSRTNRAANVDPYASHVNNALFRNEVHWLRSRDVHSVSSPS